MNDDHLRLARGIMNGATISAIIWIVLLLAAWWALT